MADLTEPIIELLGIAKRYPGVVADHDVDLAVQPGSVHAIVGENGAGKSTLMRILAGVERPDAGEVRIGGTPVRLASPADAIALGRGHGPPALPAGGQPHGRWRTSCWATSPSRVAAAWTCAGRRRPSGRSRIGTGCRWTRGRASGDLSVGQRQRVEIVKVLYRGRPHHDPR